MELRIESPGEIANIPGDNTTAGSCIAETYFYNLPIDESNKIITGDYRAFLGQKI